MGQIADFFSAAVRHDLFWVFVAGFSLKFGGLAVHAWLARGQEEPPNSASETV